MTYRIYYALSRALDYCPECETGFPIQDGNHYGTQRLGMIPSTPCKKVPAPNKWGICCEETEEIFYAKEVLIEVPSRTQNYLQAKIPQWVILVDNAKITMDGEIATIGKADE